MDLADAFDRSMPELPAGAIVATKTLGMGTAIRSSKPPITMGISMNTK